MGIDSRYEIHQNAYIKLVLHALKHRTFAVNAALIGRSSSAGDSVEIVDSVPLFHSQIGLLPPLEISLMMIEEYYGEKGLSIVGYFCANEKNDDFELASVAKNIGDHITRYFARAALLLARVLPNGKDWSPVMQLRRIDRAASAYILRNFIQLYTKDASRSWKLVGSDGRSKLAIMEPSANMVPLDYISSEKWKDMLDFHDHLDDISKHSA